MGESVTHLNLKLAVADALKKFGYKTNVEKHFEAGRMDIHAVNEETGEEIEIEIWNTNMPNRFVCRIVSGKLTGIDYDPKAQAEFEMNKARWQQLSDDKVCKPIYRERDQFLICEQFLNLIQSGHIQKESPRILEMLNNIFSHLSRKRRW